MKTRVGAVAVGLVVALADPGVAHDRYGEGARERSDKLGYQPGSTDGGWARPRPRSGTSSVTRVSTRPAT